MAPYNTYITQQVNNPLINSRPFTSSLLRLQMYVGSYVIIEGHHLNENELKNRNGHVVIRIMSQNDNNNTIHGRVFIPLYTILDRVEESDNLGNPVDPIQTGIPAGIEELVSTTKYVEACPQDIIDVCFVFHMEDVENGVVNGQGIKNCYMYRYTYNLPEVPAKQQLTHVEYTPCFPSQMEEYTAEHSPSCTGFTLWKQISRLQDELFKILNRYGERQQTRYRQKFDFDATLWRYLVYRTQGIVEEVNLSTAKGNIRSMTTKGLKRHTLRENSKKKPTMLRFETFSQLKCLRSILGNSVTIGVRKRRPRLEDSDTLVPPTTLNIVVGKDDSNNPITVLTRIDFINSQKDSHFIILYDDYNLNHNAKRLANRDENDIIHNNFIKYMMDPNFSEGLYET